MPFTALVQRQFSSHALAGKSHGIITSQTKKRGMTLMTKKRSGVHVSNNPSDAPSTDPTHTPAWILHLESTRHRSFCTTSAARTGSATLLSSAIRPTASKQLLHQHIIKSTTGTTTVQARQCKTSAQYVKDIEKLFRGNKAFREETLSMYPGFFEESAKGQKPPYMLIDCSDSRVAEQAIFDAQPGTMFTSGSIANQFHEWDLNSNSVLSYAVETLEVRHVIVMGHYGCGGVAASMLPVSLPLDHAAHIAVQTWIQPIREIYQTSNRPEIAAHRSQHKHIPLTELPELHDPAFRALVEENVKANVNRIARSYVMRDHYASLALPQLPSTSELPNDPNSLKGTHVFIHGWVYDLENGEVMDLNVTVGPPGREIPPSPWPRAEVREREKRKQREEKAKVKAGKERETVMAVEDGAKASQRLANLG